MSDVYAQLAGMLQPRKPGITPGGWLFGDVIAAGGGVLQVVCNGLQMGPHDIHVPSDLSYTWTVDHGEDYFIRAGDKLFVLVTPDEQGYYILKKAVFQ